MTAAEPDQALPHDEPRPLGPVALRARRSILIGALPAIAAFYLVQALMIELPGRPLPVSPRSFPILIGVLLVVSTSVVAIKEIRKVLQERSEASIEGTTDDDVERITNWKATWVTLGALVVYILAFPYLGFLLSTSTFLIGLSIYFAPRHWIRNVIVSVVFTIAVQALFSYLLNVRLPAGLLEIGP